MFRFFEGLVDPYGAHDETDAPPRRLWAFMREWSRPFYRVFAITAVVSFVVAAVEIGLIWYMGRVVDLLGSAEPATVWSDHGAELALAAAFVLLARPALQALDVLLLNNTIMPNYGTLYRWRAHKHVLRQSVGWFENDFAGRIANRVMQAPPAAGEAVFQVFDAIAFALAYLIGAAILSGRRRPAPRDPAARLVRALRPPRAVDDDAGGSGLEGGLGRALHHHGPRGGRLHQHPLGQALRPWRARAGARARGHRAHARHLRARDAALHDHGRGAGGAQRPADRGRGRLGGAAVVAGAGLGRGGRGGLGAGAAPQRHDGLDHVGRLLALPLARRRRRGDGDHRPADRAGGRAGCAAPAADRGPRRVRARDAPLRARARRAGGPRPRGGRGREAGRRRPLGRGQVHARQAPAALLRRRGRPHRDRRPGRARRHAGLAAPRHRHGAAGLLAPAPERAREHRLRPARGVGRRDDRGRAPRPRARVHPDPGGRRGPQRLRRPRGRARRQALGRPAPAHRARPRHPGGRADPGAGRGDLGARQRGRGRDPGDPARHDGGQDRDRHRPPPVHALAHGPDRGARRRRHRRGGHPRRAAGPRRPLRALLVAPVGRLHRHRRRAGAAGTPAGPATTREIAAQ